MGGCVCAWCMVQEVWEDCARVCCVNHVRLVSAHRMKVQCQHHVALDEVGTCREGRDMDASVGLQHLALNVTLWRPEQVW